VKVNEIKEIQLSKILVGEHEQRLSLDDDKLDGLVVSIMRVGILQPLIVREQDSEFHLVAGHRRLAAAKKANLKSCLLYTSPSPRDATLSRMPSSA